MHDLSTLTLPGTIPGLLRRGSPVITSPRLVSGVIAGEQPLSGGGRRAVVCVVCDDYAAMPTFDGPSVANVALDLTDATGRAHAAWWLGDRLSSVAGGQWVWLRAGIFWEVRCPGSRSHSFCGQDGWRANYLPVLSDLDPEDPTLLPDGSRRVDAEALRRVCLHVAGVGL